MTGADRPAPSFEAFRTRLERPVFIVSTPRSGSTLLFETLKQAPGAYTIGRESHWLIEDVRGLSPADRGWSSNRLEADDAVADPGRVEELSRAFYEALRDRDGRPPQGRVRMIEKTPKNSLRVPFFAAAYPDALFVYLYREVRATLSSMVEAWISGAFQTYPDLPGWTGRPWSLLLVPGWERLKGLPLPAVVAQQWTITTNLLLDDLGALPRDRLRTLRYDEFLAAPQATMEALAPSLGLAWDRRLGARLPLSATTVSEPKPDKWRAIGHVIESMLPAVAQADARAQAFVQSAHA